MDKLNYYKNILLKRSVRNPVSGCWDWVGHKRKGTYGDFKVKGKNIQAHRASYEVFIGVIPEDKLICHKCGNPSCVNPEHIYAGTHKENAQDRKLHGTHLEGVNHHNFGKTGKKSFNYGRKHSKETKEKLSNSLMGNKNGRGNRKIPLEVINKAREDYKVNKLSLKNLSKKYKIKYITLYAYLKGIYSDVK